MNFRQATLKDNNKILSLLSDTPQQGLVTIGFERFPNYFYGAGVTSQERFVGVLEDEDQEIVAMSAFGKRPVYVNGEIKNINYGNDVRIKKKHRGKGVLSRMFQEHQSFFAGEENICQLVILENNVDSLNKIANNRHGMLKFQSYGDYITHIISTRYDVAPKSEFFVRCASRLDIGAIQSFFNKEAKQKQFYPHYDFSKLESDDYYRNINISDYYLAFDNDEVIGILGIWKQETFKQTRIIKYPLFVKVIRPLSNIWSVFFGGFIAPDEGKTVEYTTLHTVLTKNNDPSILNGLLKKVRKELSIAGESTMLLGLMESDPLRSALKGFRGKTMKSKHFLMSTDKDIRETLDASLPVYLELGRL